MEFESFSSKRARYQVLYNMNMSLPLVRPHVTYEELCQVPSDGNRYELFDGQAYRNPSPDLRHQRIVRRLTRVFEDAVSDRSEVLFAPMDVVLDKATAVQPDLILVLEQNADILQDVVRGCPDLVVEVLSPSTEKIDRGLKMETYARYGIGEYWIVDGEKKTIEIFRLDRDVKTYRLAATCRGGEVATTPLLQQLSIAANEIFSS